MKCKIIVIIVMFIYGSLGFFVKGINLTLIEIVF
ncbi:hypothetical protein HNR33_003294 [Brassicibacter mesophilus]